MGGRTVARIFGNHLQNVAILSGLDVPWPASFRDLFSWTQIFNIDLTSLMLSLRLPTITQRLVFIAVSIALPLSLMVLTALVFFSISSITQITLVVCSLGLLILHTMAFANPEILNTDYNASVSSIVVLWFAWAGVMTVLAYRFLRHRNYDVASCTLWVGTILWGLTITGVGLVARRVILSLFAAVVMVFWFIRAPKKFKGAAVIWTLIIGGLVVWLCDRWEVYLPPQLRVLGWILLGLSIAACLTRVFSLLSTAGGTGGSVLGFFSRIRQKLTRILDTGLLTGILFLMSMVFSPVITNAMELFVCETYTCPAGYAFNPYVERSEDDPYSTSPALFCELCNFTSACGFSTYDLCPGFSSRRLLYDPATTCDDSSYISFIIASVLVLIVFLVILQVMYVKVIGICTQVMGVKTKAGHQRIIAKYLDDMQTAPIEKEIEAPPNYDDKWDDVCIRVAPKASSLYDAFRFSLRYFILIESLYKTVEVLSSTFLSPISPAACVLALLAHVAFLWVLILLRPFSDPTEHWLSVLLSGCMVLSSFYAVLVWQEPETFAQTGWAWAMLAFNVIIPLFGGAYLVYVTVRNQFCRKTLAEQRKEAAEREIKQKQKEQEKLEKSLSKRERLLKRQLEREKKIQEEMDKLERAYAKDSNFDQEELEKAKEKTSKEIKRAQMTPSEKLAEQLNAITKKYILFYFAFLAIPLLCGALVLTLISGSISGNTEFVDSSNIFDRSRETTLNGYFSWDEFASSCCCFESHKFTSIGSNITERWVCMDFANITSRENGTAGSSFFRTRVDNAGNDGLPIRPMCGLQIAKECVTQISSDDSVKMDCEEEYVKGQNITDLALEILW